MAHAFPIKKGNLLPPLAGTIENEESGAGMDLSAASVVQFVMSASGYPATVVATGVATYVPTSHPASGVGFVSYYWTAGQTGTAGWFQAELTAIFAGSKAHTVPQTGFIPVHVNDRLG